MTVKNTFRVGSTCHRAFHHLELNGRTTGAALAKALDFDEEELPGLLGLALRSGHIRRFGDSWGIGDGTPQATPPAPIAPLPAAPPPIQTAVIPPAVRDLPAAAPKAPAKPAPKLDPVVLNRPPTQGVDIDRVHVGKPLASVRPPKAAEPAPAQAPAVKEPLSPTMAAKAVVEDQKNRAMSHAVAALSVPPTPQPQGATRDWLTWAKLENAGPRLRAAWCSDGTYQIEKGDARIEIDLGEAVELFDHLRSVMAGIEG